MNGVADTLDNPFRKRAQTLELDVIQNELNDQLWQLLTQSKEPSPTLVDEVMAPSPSGNCFKVQPSRESTLSTFCTWLPSNASTHGVHAESSVGSRVFAEDSDRMKRARSLPIAEPILESDARGACEDGPRRTSFFSDLEIGDVSEEGAPPHKAAEGVGTRSGGSKSGAGAEGARDSPGASGRRRPSIVLFEPAVELAGADPTGVDPADFSLDASGICTTRV